MVLLLSLVLLRALDDLHQTPALALAHWSSFHDAYGVPDVACLLLIVGHKLFRALEELRLHGVLLLALH